MTETTADRGAEDGAAVEPGAAAEGNVVAKPGVVAEGGMAVEPGTGGAGGMAAQFGAAAELGSEAGMATAEYAIGTLGAAGIAGLLVVLLKGGDVKDMLMSLIQQALSVG